MSDSIFRIWSVARYEAKVIMRGWLFRVVFLLPLAFLALFLLSNVFSNKFTMSLMFGFYDVPSSIPWIVTIFFSVYACLVLAAVATDSASMEWRLDTLDAARVRPWSNVEQAAGKLAGQVFCFIALTAAVLLFALGIAVFTPGMIVFRAGFLLYPLIVCVPAFFLVAGLSMLVARIVRGQMLSLLIVTAVVLSSVFTADRCFHLFDITAFRLPLYFSRITGFSFPELIGRQRLLYLSAGLMMVLASTVVSRRPPGRRAAPAAAAAAAVLLLAVSLYAGLGYHHYFSEGVRLRERIRGISGRMRPAPRLKALEYDIDVDQEGRGIECSVRIVLESRETLPVDRYVFTLNPGLTVTGVNRGVQPIGFDREIHLLTVFPPEPLAPGRSDTIEVAYSGTADARAMFSDVPEEVRGADASFLEMYEVRILSGLKVFRVPRDIAPQRYDYILLVPDAMWYPVPGLPYDPGSPGEDRTSFSWYRMSVRPREGLKAVSQGERTVGETGVYLFEPERPLTGMTLAIGDFRTRSVEVDSLRYLLHHTPGSDGLVGTLECASDTIPGIIRDNRDRLEYSLGLRYPFPRLALLEVPGSFCAFGRPLRETGSCFAQPEILLVHEGGMTIGMPGIPGWIERDRKYRRGEDITEEERCRRVVIHPLRYSLSNLWSGYGRHNVYPMFFRHAVGIEGSRYPHLGLMLEHMAGEGILYQDRGRRSTDDGITDSERAGRMLSRGDLLAAVTDPGYYRWAGNMVAGWAGHHYYLITAASVEGALEEFIRDLVDTNRFMNVEEDELLESFAGRFGFRLESVYIDPADPADVPGYLFGGFDCCEFIEGERERYRAGFDAVNREGIRGVLVITAALKYPKSVQITRKRKAKNPVIAIEVLEPGESRRVEFMLDYEPTTIWINTMISRNVPSRITWGPGVEISGRCGAARRDRTGIDLSDFAGESIVVDDRDPGFETTGGGGGGLLRKLLPSSGDEREFRDTYGIHEAPPATWSPLVHERFFGAYVKSATCIRAGDGEARAIWRARIPEAGCYDVYSYIYDRYRSFREKYRIEIGLDRIEHHYTVRHADGSNEVVLLPDRCEDGWNLLGRYFFEEGEAAVELSDESPVLYVIADAVKWVKKD